MLSFNLKTTDTFSKNDFLGYQNKHLDVLSKVIKTNPDTDEHTNDLGWFDIDKWASKKRLDEINKLAKEVQDNADVLVLVGVGGSNQAARAVIESLAPKNSKCKIVYAGINLSAKYYNDLLDDLKDKDIYVDVIAKNFETLEPGIGFRVFKPFLQEKYGEDYAKHMIVTGTYGTDFEKLANDEGYPFLVFPTDIGGRYSAFSDVGLFPMAVAGIDIEELVDGAKKMRDVLMKDTSVENPAYKYASFRNYLLHAGNKIEILAHFEPQLDLFGRWWTQLFAESEGKDNKGLYPVSLSYSEDLHSVGQYVQQGQKDLSETFLIVDNSNSSLVIQKSNVKDNFDYLNDKDLWDINKVSEASSIEAHRAIGVPVFEIHLPELNTEAYGELFYFFEFAVYISGNILGVNPFNQPGVEAYKKLMFKGLGK